jgi:hypothetical protein
MIQYALKCDEGHSFESWFQSAAAFDSLSAAGHVTCPVCGSSKVKKALMTPGVPAKQNKGADVTPVLKNPPTEVEQAMAELRRQVEENSDYVGDKFADEARAMHLGDVPERSIYGEARLDQAKELIEDGVPLMPLPFRPKQKSN